jgi:SAM-dependent methyltransferase
MDAIAKMKEAAREGWAGFVPFESVTGSVAPILVNFAGVRGAANVLDVACGTGVVALSAARLGATVTGADLTPALLERARVNAELAGLKAEFREADVEALPFPDASFDFVLSQFGHMFGPRPDLTLSEMLRVLVPGGTIAFSTWPPELMTGQMFALMGRHAPPPPEGVGSPIAWGDPTVVRERLAGVTQDLTFDRGRMHFQALSPAHMREFLESNAGPVQAIARSLDADTLVTFRSELDSLIASYFRENIVRQDFLMTRATKA